MRLNWSSRWAGEGRGNRKAKNRQDGRKILVESLERRDLMAVVAVPDAYRVIQGNPLAVPAAGILANDTTTTGIAPTVNGFTNPSHGTLGVSPTGAFLYTPALGFSGSDVFTYTASDGRGGFSSTSVSLNVVAGRPQASVLASTRLASVDVQQTALLNGLLGGMLGANTTLSVLDSNGLATGNIGIDPLIDALQADLGVATPSQALDTDVTLSQVLNAAADVAQANGDTALVNALNVLSANVAGLSTPIQLGDLLQVDPNDGSLADADINALDLATGLVQLFNTRNVVTTPTPITISGSSLGLAGVLNSVQLSAQVVEPPVFVRGPVGTQFHTGGVRLKLDLDLVDLAPSGTPLASLLGGLGLANVTVSLGQIGLYTEVAAGQGTVTAIDALARAVTLQGTPGVANLYLGQISDAVFTNRTRPIDPATDIQYGNVGTLGIRITAPIVGTVLSDVSAGIEARSTALGQAPLTDFAVFDGTLPETQTIGSSATAAANLLTTLVSNLDLRLNGSLGTLLNPLVAGTILPALDPIVGGALSPVLGTVLGSVVDPALDRLGVGLGELTATVDTLGVTGSPQANNDFAVVAEDTSIAIPVLANDARLAGVAIAITAVTQPNHGTVVINADGTVTYTPAPNFFGNDTFTYTMSDGSQPGSTATVSIQVTPVNDAPVARPDTYTTVSGTPLVIAVPGVLANDLDVDGDPLSAILVSNPTHGTLTLNANGSFTYTPAAGYVGADFFSYRATDGSGQSAPVSVGISVTAAPGGPGDPGNPGNPGDPGNPNPPVTLPPVALPDIYGTPSTGNGTLTVGLPGVLANDTSPDGSPLRALLVRSPGAGTVTLNADGSFTYVPAPGYVGPDSFTYVATNGGRNSLETPVLINVTPRVTAPPILTPGDGLVITPPSATGTLKVRLKLVNRSAAYKNELGYFVVDDDSGTVAGLAPGAAGYKLAALQSPTRRILFKSGTKKGASRDVTIQSNQRIVLYMVMNAHTARAIQGRANAFFSIKAANPDSMAHARVQTVANNRLRYMWEDTLGGGDQDFNDLVMTMTYLNAQAGASVTPSARGRNR